MAQEPLANTGNFLHIYDFRVQAGQEEEFIRLFEEFDYSDGNPMHKSAAQVKDGVLCRDTEDPQRFFLIAEWADIEEHARIRKHPGERDQAGVHQADRGRQIRAEVRRGRLVHAGRDPAKSRAIDQRDGARHRQGPTAAAVPAQTPDAAQSADEHVA